MSFSPASSKHLGIWAREQLGQRSLKCPNALKPRCIALPSRRNVNIHAGWPSPDWHALHVGLPHVFLTSESAPFASGPIELIAALISRLVEALEAVERLGVRASEQELLKCSKARLPRCFFW